jgi:glutathione synthase/RimK-type ligase-like ATP-grasp enzyme
MSRILMTMNEDVRCPAADVFTVTYRVDEHDCLEYAAALEALGHDVFFVNWDDLDGRRFGRMYHANAKRFIEPLRLDDMHLIWVYQMEGFYFERSRFLRMVEIFDEAGPLVINDPRTIRHNLGKHYLWELQRHGVRVIPTYKVEESIDRRLANGTPFVLKPVFGDRGNGVFLARNLSDLDGIADKRDEYIAQDYMPSVRDGEKSLMYLGMDFHHAVIKRPCPSVSREFRCNESLGSTVSIYEPTSSELAYARKTLKVYASLGYPVHFSRIDFIDDAEGPLLMEAELLNPAAFANYSGKGRAFGRKVAEYLDRLIVAHSQDCPRPRDFGAAAAGA